VLQVICVSGDALRCTHPSRVYSPPRNHSAPHAPTSSLMLSCYYSAFELSGNLSRRRWWSSLSPTMIKLNKGANCQVKVGHSRRLIDAVLYTEFVRQVDVVKDADAERKCGVELYTHCQSKSAKLPVETNALLKCPIFVTQLHNEPLQTFMTYVFRNVHIYFIFILIFIWTCCGCWITGQSYRLFLIYTSLFTMSEEKNIHT